MPPSPKTKKQWLKRHLNDPYVKKAQQHGYRSRAAFKLTQIHEKHTLFKPGIQVLDLGAAPGGWTQIAAKEIGISGHVLAVDFLEMDKIAPHTTNLQGDITDPIIVKKIQETLPRRADLVLSDMAPSATGDKKTDHLRMMTLVDAGYEIAVQTLTKKGKFLTKIFQGGQEKDFVKKLKDHFSSVQYVKPAASRSESSEMYLLATGFYFTNDLRDV